MTKHAEVEAKIHKAYAMYTAGKSIADCAVIVGLSYCCVLRNLRKYYDDSIGRKKPREDPRRMCTVCGKPPAPRDAGKLTTTTQLEPGVRHKACSRCLVPSEEEDIAELRKTFFSRDPRKGQSVYGNSEDRMTIPCGAPKS